MSSTYDAAIIGSGPADKPINWFHGQGFLALFHPARAAALQLRSLVARMLVC
jgi:hypothetical protein